jgi:cytochrome c oxidase subunit 3
VGNEKTDALVGLFVTIVLGLIFTGFQIVEYVSATFSINDGIYGSLFYMCTGFHGFHVVVGTIFLIVCFFRQLGNHFSAQRHFGFEAAA